MTNSLALNNELMSLLNRTGTATGLPPPFARDIIFCSTATSQAQPTAT